MHRVRLALLLVALAPAAALAQTPPPTGPTGEPMPPPSDTGGVDEAKLRQMVDDAVKQALAEQKAKDDAEAAEKAKAAAAAPARPARADEDEYLTGDSGFMDTRLNLTFTNENVLVKPGETIPSVPGWRFGTPNSLGTLFFDNYDTRFSGYETLSTAIMYRDYRKGNLEAEGAFVLRMNELSASNISLSDAGSYIQVSWWRDPSHKDPTRVTLTGFPVSADRWRLGYSYRLSWGGDDEYRRSSKPVPGLKVQIDTGNAYAYVGAKSAIVLDPATAEDQAVLGFLAGAGVDVTPMVRVEANGGYFDRGGNELEDVNTQKVQLFGASAQVAIHEGMPVQSSIDYKLYKYDPATIGRLFTQQKYPGGVQWLVMSEATVLGQTLKDPEKSGSTKIQYGKAGDINVRALVGRNRFRADLEYRDLAFILHTVPSLPTYSDFPSAYKITPNFFADFGADHNWDDRLTLGAVVGVELPATLTSPTGIPGDTTGMGESTAVIRNNGQDTIITILPKGEKAVPQFAIKGSAQLNFGEIYAALLDVYYSYDGNQTTLTRATINDPFTYTFTQFNQLGVNATLQAKF